MDSYKTILIFLGCLLIQGGQSPIKEPKLGVRIGSKAGLGTITFFLFCLCCEAENYFMVKHACIWALCTTILLMPHLLNRIECFLNNLI